MFDVPTDEEPTLHKQWADGKFDSLTKAEELPELLDLETGYGSGGGFRGGQRSGGGGFNRFGSGSRGRGGGGGWGNRGRGGFNRNSGGSFRQANGPAQNKKITFD